MRNLYATGSFYNIQVTEDSTPEGIVLTYMVQGKPRLTDIKFQGNKKFSNAKLLKKISSKVGEPLDERKLFTDTPGNPEDVSESRLPEDQGQILDLRRRERGPGHGHLRDHRKPEGQDRRGGLRRRQGVLAKETAQSRSRPRKHWMFSWLTGSGYLKDEQFEEDKEKLASFTATRATSISRSRTSSSSTRRRGR